MTGFGFYEFSQFEQKLSHFFVFFLSVTLPFWSFIHIFVVWLEKTSLKIKWKIARWVKSVTRHDHQADKSICIFKACHIWKDIYSNHVAQLSTCQSLLWGNWATWLRCCLLAARGEQAFSRSRSAPVGLKVAWRSCSLAAQILQWLTVADRMEQLSIQIYSVRQESRPARRCTRSLCPTR